MKKRMLVLAAAVAASVMMASPVMADDFKIGICNYVDDASLNQIVENIQARLEEIQSIIAKRGANETQYDDSIVRQMIECIKVHRNGRLTIIFGGGYEIEETL